MKKNENARIEKEFIKAEQEIEARQRALDEINEISKSTIRVAGKIIAEIHAGSVSKDSMEKLRNYANKLKAVDREFRWHALQALQEYTEAEALYSIKNGATVPSISELGVSAEAYLLGMMDVVGELRREITDLLNSGELKQAERFYLIICSIFDITRGMRYTEALMPGFRRKQDVARIQMENAGSEILFFKSRR